MIDQQQTMFGCHKILSLCAGPRQTNETLCVYISNIGNHYEPVIHVDVSAKTYIQEYHTLILRTSFQKNTNSTFQAECLNQFWQTRRAILLPPILCQLAIVHIRLIYVNTQHNSPPHGWKIGVKLYLINLTITMSTCEIFMFNMRLKLPYCIW